MKTDDRQRMERLVKSRLAGLYMELNFRLILEYGLSPFGEHSVLWLESLETDCTE